MTNIPEEKNVNYAQWIASWAYEETDGEVSFECCMTREDAINICREHALKGAKCLYISFIIPELSFDSYPGDVNPFLIEEK